MTGPEMIEICKRQVYQAWVTYRRAPEGDDLAVFVYTSGPGKIEILVAPRLTLIGQLSSEGVDFSKHPELQTRASENNPTPAIGIWVIVGLEKDDTQERSVFITRFVEPLFGRFGGGATIGVA
jgi:hypothetical protein